MPSFQDINGEDWLRISVKYANTCEVCRAEILRGEAALWLKGSGRIKHVSCNGVHPAGIQTSHPTQDNSDSFDAEMPVSIPSADEQLDGFEDQADKPPVSISIEEPGRRLEDMVSQILRSLGYSTQVRQVLQGKSGSRNEIDILAKKGERITAVECKNYSKFVGADQLREFKSKLDDLQIKDALFVTNVAFSRDAEMFANHHHIQLWDGRRLRENFFSMTIGRLGSVQEVILKNSLPVNVTFEHATKLDLANPSAIRIQRPKLIFHPYYRFDYSLDIARRDPGRGMHRVTDSGSVVVDAVDGEILNEGKTSGILSRFASVNLSEDDEAVASQEERHTVKDLLTMKPEHNYRVTQGKDFDIIRLQYGVTFKSARYSVVDRIVKANTKDVIYHIRVSRNETRRKKMPIIPKPNEVYIKKISMIYVPMWSVDMEGNDISYSRRILASSGTILIDNIAHCPKHLTIGKMQFVKKQTYAVCEMCGGAFCKDHIPHIDRVFYCHEHVPATGRPSHSSNGEKQVLDSLKKSFGSFLRK